MCLIFVQKLITILLKDVSGKGQIHWGSPEHQPEFWPSDVPFVNPKTKPAIYTDPIQWKLALADILVAMYEFHGYDPKVWTKDTVSFVGSYRFCKPVYGSSVVRIVFLTLKDIFPGTQLFCFSSHGDNCQRQGQRNAFQQGRTGW